MSDQQHIADVSTLSDESTQHPEAGPLEKLPLPGALLAAQRRARGWSVEYVASHLKLATRQIHALEEDRYDALPSAVVIRGFVRIYAKMLNIDSAALVAALPVNTAPADAQIKIMPSRALSTPFSESSLPLRGRNEFPIGRLVWLTVALLLIAGIFGATKYGAWNEIKKFSLLQRLHVGGANEAVATAPAAESRDTGADPAVVADSENLPAEVAPSAQPEIPSADENAPAARKAQAVPVTPAVQETLASASPPVAPAAKAPATPAAAVTQLIPPTPPAPVVPPTSVVLAGPASGAAPVASGANSLKLTIRQDSWVEIRRADRSIVVSRILKAGTSESFDVDEPVSMIVGNVSGVDATLRGKPLELISNSGSNVARLNVK